MPAANNNAASYGWYDMYGNSLVLYDGGARGSHDLQRHHSLCQNFLVCKNEDVVVVVVPWPLFDVVVVPGPLFDARCTNITVKQTPLPSIANDNSKTDHIAIHRERTSIANEHATKEEVSVKQASEAPQGWLSRP